MSDTTEAYTRNTSDTSKTMLFHKASTPLDPFGTKGLVISGPLMTSAISIFGNQSFFYIAENSSNTTFQTAIVQICQQGNIPFSRLASTQAMSFHTFCDKVASDPDDKERSRQHLGPFLGCWIKAFEETDNAEEFLSASMYFANQAMLTQTVEVFSGSSARQITTAPGRVVLRPGMTWAASIVISVLIFLQLVGLAYLVWYIYRVPTWTPALDAIAVARIGANLEKTDLPPIGPVHEEDEARLAQLDGLVGLAEEEPDDATKTRLGSFNSDEHDHNVTASNDGEDNVGGAERTSLTASYSTALQKSSIKLGLGAPGLVSRRQAPPFKKPWKGSKKKEEEEKTKGEKKYEQQPPMPITTPIPRIAPIPAAKPIRVLEV